ncbi:MAG: APC family permease [Thermoanaerobaculia bacterium]
MRDDRKGPHSGEELLRALGLFDTAALVVGTIIGSGIFLVPAEIARAVHSAPGMLAVWGAGGLLTLLGALSLAELGAAMPNAGGIYSYITRAFGRLPGFLCGWMMLTVSTSGSIATLGAAVPIYLGGLLPLTPAGGKLASLAAILLFTAINVAGVRSGALVQNVLTVLKVGGLAVMIAVIFLAPSPAVPSAAPAPGGPVGLAAVGVALVAVLWAYEGWHDVAFAAGEIREPQRNLPRGLVAGTAAVVGLYLAANLAYLHVLSPEEIASSERVALTAIRKVAGEWGGKFLTAAIVCSILGAMNALVLAGPRAYYQMAKDGLFFEGMGRVHATFRTPVPALLLQAAWACVLVLFIGGFSQLFTYVVFGGWIFFALAVASVVVLRRKDPGMERPFRVPGYPLVPLLFVLAAAALVANTLLASPRESSIGLAFISLGIPLYFLTAASKRRGPRRLP